MLNIIKMLALEQSGQGITEYVLILTLLAVVAVSVLVGIGPKVAVKFKNVSDQL